MIELSKSNLEPLLLNISAVNSETGQLVSGLLTENIPLGTKRRLQKIHKAALVFYKELIEDDKEVRVNAGEDTEKLEKELKELYSETVKVDAEKVSMSIIESISSKINYNFEVIEKITF